MEPAWPWGGGGAAVRLCLVRRSDGLNLGFFPLLFLPLLGLKPMSMLQKWTRSMALSAWAGVVSLCSAAAGFLTGDENFHFLVERSSSLWVFFLEAKNLGCHG